jgi:hypothetical protein
MTEAAILRSTLQILTARGVIYQDGRHEKQCEICGRAFAVKKSRLAVARFCSQQCGGAWHATTRLAILHAARGHGPTEKACAICGSPVVRYGSKVPSEICCSRACLGKLNARRFSGSGSARWMGGAAAAKARRKTATPKAPTPGVGKLRPCKKCSAPTMERHRVHCAACIAKRARIVVPCVSCGRGRVFSGISRAPNPQCKNCHWASVSGPNNPNWQGGKSTEGQRIRRSPEYKQWRRAVFERDNFRCVFCGQLGGELHADHIKPFAHFPELRTELSNGRTLCRTCHEATPTYLNRSRHAAP